LCFSTGRSSTTRSFSSGLISSQNVQATSKSLFSTAVCSVGLFAMRYVGQHDGFGDRLDVNPLHLEAETTVGKARNICVLQIGFRIEPFVEYARRGRQALDIEFHIRPLDRRELFTIRRGPLHHSS